MPIDKPEDPCKKCGGISYELTFKGYETAVFVCCGCGRKEIYRVGSAEPEVIDPPKEKK